MRPFRASIRAGWSIGVVAAAVAAAGCAHSKNRDARTVTIAEFAQPAAVEGAAGPAGVGDEPETVQPVVATALGDAGGLDPYDFVEPDEFSDRAILRPTEPGETVIVDSLVGHVNGRPVFADDFLQPIEDRLLRAAEDSSGVERQQVFRAIINDWLQDVVTNPLRR